jgi:hypothetical protein
MASTVGNYRIRDDQSYIDEFVKRLYGVFGDEIIKVSVSGLTTPPAKNRGRPHVEPNPDNHPSLFWVKRYRVKVTFKEDKCRLVPIIEAVETSDAEDFYTGVLKPISNAINDHFLEECPEYRNMAKCSIGFPKGHITLHIRLNLPIAVNDIVVHCGTQHVTQYADNLREEFVDLCRKEINERVDVGIQIYNDYSFREIFFRRVENQLRLNHDVPEIGKSHISQFLLYRFILENYPDAKYEYSPEWLGRQRYDIYLPAQKVAIEYNGLQHYEPIDFWGGDEGLKKTQKRDRRKARKSNLNNIDLYIWHYRRPITRENVQKLVKEYIENPHGRVRGVIPNN